jgi:hypothetical protein
VTHGQGLSRGQAAAAVAPVTALAAATLWWPNHGDQSLFVIGAQELSAGFGYYRDFWDIKQPGIYWFYQLGGLLDGPLGSPGLGARVLESLLAIVAGVLVLVVTGGWDLRRSVRLAAPTLVLGPYLVWSFLAGVGQIEGLMNVVLLAVMAASWPARDRTLRPGWAWALAGAGCGVTAVLKTLYLPLPLLLLTGAAIASHRVNARACWRRLGLAALGALVPVLATVAYLVGHGVFALALYTTFALPAQIAANPNTHALGAFAELERAIKNTLCLTGPLALVGMLGAWRRATATRDLALAAVAIVGAALALPQLFTPYRLLILATPIGLLAVSGLESVLRQLQARVGDVHGPAGLGETRRPARAWAVRSVAAVVLVALALPPLRQPAHLLAGGSHSWGLDVAARTARSGEEVPTPAERAAAVVSGRVRPQEQIYVIGDPTVMLLLGARQGVEVTGWSLEMLPSSVWAELTRELNRSRPRLVYVEDVYRQLIARSGSEGQALQGVFDRYDVVSDTADGIWYETSQPGIPLPASGGAQCMLERTSEDHECGRLS